MRVYLISFPPNYCPACGVLVGISGESRFDFKGGASFSCECGARFCYVPGEKLVEVADEVGSDLPNYVKREVQG